MSVSDLQNKIYTALNDAEGSVNEFADLTYALDELVRLATIGEKVERMPTGARINRIQVDIFEYVQYTPTATGRNSKVSRQKATVLEALTDDQETQ